MMKPAFRSLLVLALLGCAPFVAAGEKPATSGGGKSGTITAWDGATHTVTIKTSVGKSLSFHWNEKTRVHGIAKLGEHVTITSTKDKDGELWATLIEVAPKPAPAKTPATK